MSLRVFEEDEAISSRYIIKRVCRVALLLAMTVFLGACVTPPVRGSDILSARLRRVPSKSLIRRLNLQCRFSHSQISLGKEEKW